MKSAKLLTLLAAMLSLVGCHFVGDSEAVIGSSGFFAGIWDGTVLIWSIVLTCFTDIQILDLHNSGFFYKVGFAMGSLFLSWNIGLILGFVSLVFYALPF